MGLSRKSFPRALCAALRYEFKIFCISIPVSFLFFSFDLHLALFPVFVWSLYLVRIEIPYGIFYFVCLIVIDIKCPSNRYYCIEYMNSIQEAAGSIYTKLV